MEDEIEQRLRHLESLQSQFEFMIQPSNFASDRPDPRAVDHDELSSSITAARRSE